MWLSGLLKCGSFFVIVIVVKKGQFGVVIVVVKTGQFRVGYYGG